MTIDGILYHRDFALKLSTRMKSEQVVLIRSSRYQNHVCYKQIGRFHLFGIFTIGPHGSVSNSVILLEPSITPDSESIRIGQNNNFPIKIFSNLQKLYTSHYRTKCPPEPETIVDYLMQDLRHTTNDESYFEYLFNSGVFITNSASAYHIRG